MFSNPKNLYRKMRRDMEKDIRYSERMQDKEEGQLIRLLKMVREGDITDDRIIEKNAKELGYTLEKIKKMAFEGHDFTKGE